MRCTVQKTGRRRKARRIAYSPNANIVIFASPSFCFAAAEGSIPGSGDGACSGGGGACCCSCCCCCCATSGLMTAPPPTSVASPFCSSFFSLRYISAALALLSFSSFFLLASSCSRCSRRLSRSFTAAGIASKTSVGMASKVFWGMSSEKRGEYHFPNSIGKKYFLFCLEKCC